MKQIILLLIISLFVFSQANAKSKTDVLIIGGGASGTMAAIQAARTGVSVIVVEETPWLGGMLTSAGVSAIDGNYRLHSGLWEEFRQKLNKHYGGEEKVKTGWVSNVLFEPGTGQEILSQMVANEKNIKVFRKTIVSKITKKKNGWVINAKNGSGSISMEAKIVVDATELGDIAKMVGIPYSIGMDSRFDSGEEIAPKEANNIIQDLTYVAILKDFGEGADKTITKPANYDPSVFFCTCAGKCDPEDIGRTLWPCDKMMTYGKLPNDYYMINWPIYGNDYYLNIIELTPQEREKELQKAKNFTLQYIYYLQTELGFKNFGIADDVYPTNDGLPFIPYHRESRRIKGLVRFTVNDLARPFEQENPLYRTGIAVGDYPVDHHHAAYPEANNIPDLHFYPVPSYSLPLGTLIPQHTDDFIVAEKSISVTNLVNGTTRLQPVCLLIGQAAGALAALSVKEKTSPGNISVRAVQNQLLESEAFLMPYSDVNEKRSSFKAIQRIGATGILRGEGKNIGWENHTHFYPDSILSAKALTIGLKDWLPSGALSFKDDRISFIQAIKVIQLLGKEFNLETGKLSLSQIESEAIKYMKNNHPDLHRNQDLITREFFSVILDKFVNPFDLRDVDHNGIFKGID